MKFYDLCDPRLHMKSFLGDNLKVKVMFFNVKDQSLVLCISDISAQIIDIKLSTI